MCNGFGITAFEKERSIKMKAGIVDATNFNGINISKSMKGFHSVHLGEIKEMESITSGVDVFIRSVVKKFPYRKSTMTLPAIEFSARPQNLSFWEKLCGKKTVKDYFPTGNIGELIREGKTAMDIFKDVVAKAQSLI